MYAQKVQNVSVGDTVRVEDLRVTLTVFPAPCKHPCANCFFAKVSQKKCKEYRTKVVGECISWMREDNERVLFKAL